MDLSIFNNGSLSGSNGAFVTGQNYDDDQYSVNGKSLAPTPLENGQMPAVDPSSDDRTPWEHKQQAQQVNQDASPNRDDADQYIVGQDGHQYPKVPEDRKSQLMTSIIAYGTSYLAGHNEGQSLYNAGKALDDHLNMVHRQGQIKDLETKGYNPVDIERWITTGDNRDLLTNQGKWSNVGNGLEMNNLTGKTRQIPGYHAVKTVANTVPLGDKTRVYYTDGTSEDLAQGAKPEAGYSGGFGGGGEDGTETGNQTIGTHRNANNDLVVGSYDKHNRYVETPASADQRKGYEADHPNDGEKGGNKNSGSVYDDTVNLRTSIDSLTEAQKQQVFNLTNLASDQAQNALTATKDPAVRNAYNLLNTYKGQLSAVGFKRFKDSTGNPAKSDADNAAAARMAPTLDTTSYDQFQNSFGRSFAAMSEANGWDKDKFNGDVETHRKQQPATVQAPSGAVQHLRENPGLADAFDQKYGKGAAKAILGG